MRRSIALGAALWSIAGLPCASPFNAPGGGQPPARAPADKAQVVVEKEDYLDYGIPEDAIKGRTYFDRRGETESVNYFDRHKIHVTRVSDPSSPFRDEPEWVGTEGFSVKTKRLVRRELFTNIDGRRVRHGVQREWYEDGNPKSEEPYRNGLMHGLFQYWDEQGRLVGCYRMVDGTGARKIYFPNGRLREEYHYRSGVFHGPHYQFHDNGQMWSMGEADCGRWLGGLDSIQMVNSRAFGMRVQAECSSAGLSSTSPRTARSRDKITGPTGKGYRGRSTRSEPRVIRSCPSWRRTPAARSGWTSASGRSSRSTRTCRR